MRTCFSGDLCRPSTVLSRGTCHDRGHGCQAVHCDFEGVTGTCRDLLTAPVNETTYPDCVDCREKAAPAVLRGYNCRQISEDRSAGFNFLLPNRKSQRNVPVPRPPRPQVSKKSRPLLQHAGSSVRPVAIDGTLSSATWQGLQTGAHTHSSSCAVTCFDLQHVDVFLSKSSTGDSVTWDTRGVAANLQPRCEARLSPLARNSDTSLLDWIDSDDEDYRCNPCEVNATSVPSGGSLPSLGWVQSGESTSYDQMMDSHVQIGIQRLQCSQKPTPELKPPADQHAWHEEFASVETLIMCTVALWF